MAAPHGSALPLGQDWRETERIFDGHGTIKRQERERARLAGHRVRFRRLHEQSFGVADAEAEAVVPVMRNRRPFSDHLQVELDLDVALVSTLILVVRASSARRRLG